MRTANHTQPFLTALRSAKNKIPLQKIYINGSKIYVFTYPNKFSFHLA